MTKAWRIVLWAAAAVLVIGLVLAGVGFLTGASVTRIVDLAFGGKAGLQTQLDNARGLVLWTQQTLRDTVLGIF